jgi:Zn-dependent M28 family amino/carboxypeptidase
VPDPGHGDRAALESTLFFGDLVMRRRALVGYLASAALLLGTLATAAGPGDGAVREGDIAATVRFLSSPELEGRGAAERGGAVASAYVAARLEGLGWIGAGDEAGAGRSFFQTVPAISARLAPEETELRVTWSAPADGRAVIAAGDGGMRIVPDRADSVDAAGEMAFAGFGIRAPEQGHDDYAGLDVAGKIVLVLSGEPGELDPRSKWNGTKPTRHAPVSSKRALASSLGAKALLVVPNPAGRAKSAADLARGSTADGSDTWIGPAERAPSIPVIYLEPEAAARILAGSGVDLAAATARTIPGRAGSLHVAYRDRKQLSLRNVVARLGSGRGLDGEVVVLGAHWDHLGMPGGVLHPGADDNASGIAGLLAVAEALRAEPPSGSREVVIAGWTGEERQQIGSAWFAAHPVVARERVAVAVNLDMLGRRNLDREDYEEVLQVIYSAGAPVLRSVASKANEGVGFDLRFYPSLRFRPVSDHASFSDAGMPIVYPFSGYHTDYHAPADTPEKVSPARIARAARFVARLVRGLAAHEGPIRLDPTIREAPQPDPFDMPYNN